MKEKESAPNYTAEELNDLFHSGALERIGMGSRRSCYRLRRGGSLCFKCYKSEDEIAEGKNPGKLNPRKLEPSVVREIEKYRFDERRNTCCQEYRYWKNLKLRVPAELMSAFPETMEIVKTKSRGWCLVEELIVNEDGTPIVKFLPTWRKADESGRKELLSALDAFESMLVRHTVRFFDPQTIMVQSVGGGFRLRVPDFEPATRTLIPIDVVFPALTRAKIRRRFARYRKTLGL